MKAREKPHWADCLIGSIAIFVFIFSFLYIVGHLDEGFKGIWKQLLLMVLSIPLFIHSFFER